MFADIAALSVMTGIAPNELMDTPFEILDGMVKILRRSTNA